MAVDFGVKNVNINNKKYLIETVGQWIVACGSVVVGC